MRITTRRLMIAIAAVAALLSAFEAGRRWERVRYHRFTRNIYNETLRYRIPDAWVEDNGQVEYIKHHESLMLRRGM